MSNRIRTYVLQCHRCGEDFRAIYPTGKWCSYRCSNDAYIDRRREWRREARILNCGQCGVRFNAKRRDASFCSPACKQRAYRLRTVTALGCDKFTATGKRNGGGQL